MAYQRKHRFGQVIKLRSGNYQARYKLDGGMHYGPQTWANREFADRWLDETFEKMQEGVWRPQSGGLETFKTWGERWRQLPKKNGQPRKYKTAVDYESTLRVHVYPLLGDIPVERIDVSTIYRFQEQLAKKFKNGCDNRRCTTQPCRTRQKAEKYASYVLDFASKRGALRMNPYQDPEVFMPWVDSKRQWIELDEDDIRALREQMHPHYRVAIMVAAYMGLRAGELWALRRSSVNPLKKTLRVDSSVAEVSGMGLVTGDTKTYQTRVLSIPPPVMSMIEAHMEKVPGKPGDWLFPNQHGKQNRHTTWGFRFFQPAATRAKLPEGVVPNDLRHFCAVYHISQGYELSEISFLLGHASIQITHDVYGGLFDERRREMAEKVGAAITAHEAASLAVKVLSIPSVDSASGTP